MITYADLSMLDGLKSLWKEAFGDDDAYIELFYSRRFAPEQTLVWAEKGQPLAMMTLMPAHLRTGDGLVAARYIYGVATKQEHRGRGISTALLESAAEAARKNGEVLLLVPSNEGLFRFYGRRGYKPFFFLKDITLTCTGNYPSLSFEPLSPEDYKSLRDRYFDAPGYLCWDAQAISYALLENAHLGGKTISLSYGGMRHAVMLLKQRNTLLIRETTLPVDALLPALGNIAKSLGCYNIRARLFACDSSEAKPFGMIYEDSRVKENSGYLNLALD